MKKLGFATLALMVLAGSTLTISSIHGGYVVARTMDKKGTVKPSDIPPPNCPINDPTGCNIFG